MRVKVVGLIPARWASTRFPGKPLYPIAGKPLLQHVWERCRRANSLTSVIVATDDMRIAEAAFDWGAEVALTSAKHHSGTDRAAEVIADAKEFTHVINIQGDEPLVEAQLINRLVREFERDPELEMVTAAHPFADASEAQSPHQVKVVIDSQSNALYFSRFAIPFIRDDRVAVTHLRHQGIY
ncbi:MAG: 3-deoxy-manno-octulosonate cytidylyltransferase, partial [Chthoniobacterales bacterium]